MMIVLLRHLPYCHKTGFRPGLTFSERVRERFRYFMEGLYESFPSFAIALGEVFFRFRLSHSIHELTKVSLKMKDVTFVQIGAHDGRTGNRLFHWISKSGWKGLFVEPVPYLFEELQKNF